MQLFLKPKEHKNGFYVDAKGNTYIQDGDFFIPLYPTAFHKSKVQILSMNGSHKKTEAIENYGKVIINKQSEMISGG